MCFSSVSEYEIYVHIETMLCLQKEDSVFCHMFQLFFAEKHILSELDIWLFPRLFIREKSKYYVRYKEEYSL